MKNILLISAVLFAIAACADSRQTGGITQKDEFDINDYIGTFRISKTGWDESDPKLIITKNGNEFRIINQDEYGGEYSCVLDKKIVEDWGRGDMQPCIYFDCKALSLMSEEDWWNKEFQTPYIRLCHYISDYKNVDYDVISYANYFRGKKHYKMCSAEENKQACKYWGGIFYLNKTGG
ncbi:MAG: hypothetical protein LBJ73_02000 [Rickettsiales bacterium]|jgi:hypothetical protein|nr:hypothetical protein [Rickettsiales bacterium]